MDYRDKVELTYEFYKSLSREDLDQKNQYFTGEAGNENNVLGRLFEYTSGLFDRNGFPEVLPDKYWECVNEPVYYHGFKDYDFGANILNHFNYHMGIGVSGNGFYLTKNYNQAYNYTLPAYNPFDNNPKDSRDSGKVLSVKLTGNKMLYRRLGYLVDILTGAEKLDEEMFDEHELEKVTTILNFLNEKKKDESLTVKMFLFVIDNNPTILANMLGVDYLDLYNKEGDNPFIIVLNRSSMVVKESDKDRFTQNSTHYKSGGYDESGNN